MIDFPEIQLPDGSKFKPVRVWFPAENQLAVMPNENWLHSAWLGLFYTVFHLPFMIYSIVLKPMFFGVFQVCVMVGATLVHGLRGRLDAYNLPPGLMMMARVRLDAYNLPPGLMMMARVRGENGDE